MKWKMTDVDEMGYEFECPACHRHITVHAKDAETAKTSTPKECPYCSKEMEE